VPQIGPFDAAILANDTSDVTPVDLRRFTPGALSRGLVAAGTWAAVTVPAPYVVLPAKPRTRTGRATGTRAVDAIGLITSIRVRVAGDVDLGKPDRLLYSGRWWTAVDCRDWVEQSNYFAATFEIADEPEGEGALPI
jgi:hypothetical protein